MTSPLHQVLSGAVLGVPRSFAPATSTAEREALQGKSHQVQPFWAAKSDSSNAARRWEFYGVVFGQLPVSASGKCLGFVGPHGEVASFVH